MGFYNFMHLFIVLHLPTKEHLESFIENHQFKNFKKSFDIVVHFSPENVVKLRIYQKLISSLNSKKHLYLNERNEYETNII